VICFLGQPLFRAADRFHSHFRLWDDAGKLDFTDDLNLHTIELTKLRVPADKLSTPLECWAYFLQHAEELDADGLPAPLSKNPQIRDAMNELSAIARSPEERARYERELKRWRDEQMFLQGAKREGVKEGEALGRVAILIADIHEFERALNRSLTPEEVLRVLPESELRTRKEECWKELLSKLPSRN
jgi:hypothetical protein